jgi:hypothetical protein
VTQVDVRYTPGSRKRVHQVLDRLGYFTPNTSAIEWRNGTARRMSGRQVRKSLAFSRRPETRLTLDWWGVTLANRPNVTLEIGFSRDGIALIHLVIGFFIASDRNGLDRCSFG